jgi:hypothetical protein
MFSNQGDSGALILRDSPSGTVILGMLVGGDGLRLSYALPLQPALRPLDAA